MSDTLTFRPRWSGDHAPSHPQEASPTSAPAKPRRLGTLQGFLPLNDHGSSAVLAARGHLPHLLSTGLTRSSSGIWYHQHERDRYAITSAPSDQGSVKSRRGSDSFDDVASVNGSGLSITGSHDTSGAHVRRRGSHGARDREPLSVLHSEEMRSQRLIGNSNPRYKWSQYWKTDDELKQMRKPLRAYYERNNSLIQQYTFIDRLLDSSLPHDLIKEYGPSATPTTPRGLHSQHDRSAKVCEDCGDSRLPLSLGLPAKDSEGPDIGESEATLPTQQAKVKRTPKNLYKVPESASTPDESTPLLKANPEDPENPEDVDPLMEWTPEEEADNSSRIVSFAIYLNLVANVILLILKIIVAVMTSSVSVLASLVDAALDFLSTAIIWITTRIINRNSAFDKERYPVGRRRLEPLSVLIFSVVMITAFVQVAIEGLNRLTSDDHRVVQLSVAAIAIMASTVGVKGTCWFLCKAVKNSSVQALAQDAMTDVVFNIFSIIFPLIGFYAKIWWLDPLGGILLSIWVIVNWSGTSAHHIARLTGAAADADERNVLLYLTMRFAKTIKQIQGLNAYHAGDKLNVEVDVVLDEQTSLKDSHDLGESLQYVLESVPYVDRAFVHLDYAGYNLPSHMQQQED